MFEYYNSNEIAGTGSWADANFYLAEPAAGAVAPSEDFSGFGGYPSSALMDATTMEVLENSCYFPENCISDHI